MSSKHDYTLPILVGLGIAALWYLMKGGGGPAGGTSPAGSTLPGATSSGSTGLTNPNLSPIGTTAAQAAGSTGLTAPLGATNPFSITSMSWS
jgi:hypothetical protein